MSLTDLFEAQNLASLIGGTIVIFYVVWQIIEKAFANVEWIKKRREKREQAHFEKTERAVAAILNDTVIPPILEEIEALNEEQNKKLDRLLKSSNDTMRSELLRIYFKYHAYKKIPQWAKQTAIYMYEDYVAQDGNSFIQDLWEQIKTWEVVPTAEDVFKKIDREEI